MGQVISAGILLVVVVAIYIAVNISMKKAVLGRAVMVIVVHADLEAVRQIRNSTLRRIE